MTGRARTFLSALVALAVALSPAAALAAATSGDRTNAAASQSVAPQHCHKMAAKAPAAIAKDKTCRHCPDQAQGSCAADTCALKCFKVLADLTAPVPVFGFLLAGERPFNFAQPIEWLQTPPAPPPRA